MVPDGSGLPKLDAEELLEKEIRVGDNSRLPILVVDGFLDAEGGRLHGLR